MSPDWIKDDSMTFGQFKRTIKDEIEKMFPGNFNEEKYFNWHQEAWHD